MKIGVIRGGEEDYENSIARGGKFILHMLESMPDYKVIDIFIDKENKWHINGVAKQPREVYRAVDLVYNTAHPSYAKFIENFGVNTFGPSSLAHGLVYNRPLLENFLKQAKIKMPRSILLPAYQKSIDGDFDNFVLRKAREVFEKFGAPYIVRDFNHSKHIGIHVARTYPELVSSLREIFIQDESVLVEELISGQSVSAHTVAKFKGQDVYAIPMSGYKHKEKEDILELARQIHRLLEAGPYLKSDFVIHPKRGIFCVNLDLHPHLQPDSHFCKNCNEVGINPSQILEHFFKNY